ncbi:hypothetical protein HK407_03g05350 [Ordospora pajunii]|jgi:hypothetical protein|uniref:uncharacterized protein n=1 Tax=Ordospora pajunii TaxID=3039483 RepID=UPI0029528A1C|nr:uncharacterized protein HK407_03g05350 [Ordospora pajunii]KAH9411785.1 hypothetical protein HK407_03g05350 [Ordospora pajunii]
MHGESMRTLYIKNLNKKLPITEVKRRLHLLVSGHFKALKVKMSNKPSLLGQAFVLLDQDVTEAVIGCLDKMVFLGTMISVCAARSDMCIGRRMARIATSTLLITSIPSSTSKEDLDAILHGLKGFQCIRFIRVKNLAFVDFASVDDASEAYSKLNDELISYLNGAKVSPSA